MRVNLIEIRNVDFQDKHIYLIEVKTRNMKLLTLGKFNEKSLTFEYHNYYTNTIEKVDIFENRKLISVFSIEGMIRDIEYSRIFNEGK
jgi:hypothetical protein